VYVETGAVGMQDFHDASFFGAAGMDIPLQ
jgi:hypothetical protein